MKRLVLGVLFSAALSLQAQEDHSGHGGHAAAMKSFYGVYAPSREASGTAWVPDASPHEGAHVAAGGWTGMVHGYAYGVYTRQGGERGQDRVFGTNMLMLMAQRPAGEATLGVRGMLSLEPLMGKKGYPLLLQTGETADRRTPLIDRQHPHDLFMELALTYSRPVGGASSLFVYAGLPGEPALGPAAFMHRFSGADNPEAPLSHHWLDATHITFGVLTAGAVWRDVKLEASAFKGREPDEDRWNIESPELDSYSGRLTWNAGENWSMQASYGDLESPELLAPEADVERWTASVSHGARFAAADWQTTLAWGRNREKAGGGHGHEEDATLLESAAGFAGRHTVFGRFEIVEKFELFLPPDPRGDRAFTVRKAGLGYIRDFAPRRGTQLGVGGAGSVHLLPRALDAVYGKTPLSCNVFLRLKFGVPA
jgi:hypothetical protein